MSEDIFKRLEGNPLLWFDYLFPHHRRKESPYFHLDLMNAMNSYPKVAVAAPRGSAKSTILAFVKPLHNICFKKSRFIAIISNTFKKAAMSLETMKKEFQDNHQLQDWFPIEIVKDAEGDSIFRHKDGFEICVQCKGVDQIGSMRGIKFGAYRPDLVIGDDMEDDELVRSAERRLQLKEDFDTVITPIGDNASSLNIIIIGTVLHDDSLLSKLIHKDFYKEFHKMFYQARIERNGVMMSLWPEKWSVEELNAMEKNQPTVFAKEYQNDPVAGGNQRFKRDNFRRWQADGRTYNLTNEHGEVISRGSLSDCVPAISCDLAWKEKRESDSCVIMPGYLTPASEILIEDYICEKGLKPNDIAEHLFIMVERMQRLCGVAPAVGFEKAMLENVTKWFLKQEMRRRNKFIVTKELVWDADKITRIETRLIPRYAQHVLFHKAGMGDLEHQLERFPYGTHDDLIDAEQGLIQLLQFPRQGKKVEAVDDEFEWWRTQAIEAKKRPTHGFNGTKYQVVGLPTRKSFR